jgi:outer membrane autotransporter protein
MEIKVDDTSAPNREGEYDLITAKGAVTNFDASKLQVENNPVNSIQWSLLVTSNGNIKLKKGNNTVAATEVAHAQALATDPEKVLNTKEEATQSAQVLATSQPGSQGAKINTEINNLKQIDAVKGAEAFERVSNVTAATASFVTADIGNVVNNRVVDISAPVVALTPVFETTTSSPASNTGATGASGATGSSSPNNNNANQQKQENSERKVSDSGVVTGVGAGDNMEKFGVWMSPFYGSANQNRIYASEGYRLKSYGSTFGFDSMINDDSIAGAALTLAEADIKHKGAKSGDKTNVNSIIGTVYGLHNLNSSLFVQGLFSFGSNSIRNNENRIVALDKSEIAKGRYTSMSLGTEAMLGANIPMFNRVVITPTIGMSFARINDGSYTESGTTNQNLQVSKKAMSKLELVFGLRAASAPFMINEVVVTPEIHGGVRHDIRGEKPRVIIRIGTGNGSEKSVFSDKKPDKVSRTSYNAGVGLNAKYSYMEYGIGYDMQLSRKYVARQGSLKIKVNF